MYVSLPPLLSLHIKPAYPQPVSGVQGEAEVYGPDNCHEVYNEAWQEREGHQKPEAGNRNSAPAEARKYNPDAGFVRDEDGLLRCDG